jgi:hypothetical protein
VVVVADQARVKAVAEQVAVAAVALVEGLGVAAVQAVHPIREPLPPRLDDQVEVVVEQDPSDAVPGVAADREAGEAGPGVTVVVVADDRLTGDATRRDVEDAVGG